MEPHRLPAVGFGILHRTMYVITMGWVRWGRDARLRWLANLRCDCLEVARRIDEMLEEEGVS